MRPESRATVSEGRHGDVDDARAGGPLTQAGRARTKRSLWHALLSPRYAVAFFVLALPLWLSEQLGLGPVDVAHIIAIGVLLLTAGQRLAAHRTPLPWHPAAWWPVILVMLAFVSTITARDQMLALQQTVVLSIAVAVALIVSDAFPHVDHLRRMILILAVVGGALCAPALTSADALQPRGDGVGSVAGRAVGMFHHPNELGTFTCIMVFVGLGLALGARRRLERVVGVLCTGVAGGALMMTMSRGAWIGAFGALLVLLVVVRSARRPLLLIFAGILVAGVVVLRLTSPHALGLMVGRVLTIADTESNPEDARPLIYREALRQIADRPVNGHGPGNFTLASHAAETLTPAINPVHGHNVLLTVAAETGLPGAAVLVAFIVTVAVQVWDARTQLSPPDWQMLVGVACGLLAALGQGLVDFTYRNPAILLLVWTVVGLVLAGTRLGAQAQPAGQAHAAVYGDPEGRSRTGQRRKV